MEQENRCHPIAVYAAECRALPLCRKHYPQKQGKKQHYYNEGSQKTPFFANGAENEIGALFRHKIVFGLSALQKSFAMKSARTNGNFTLVYIVARPFNIRFFAQQNINPLALVRLQHLVENIAYAKHHSAESYQQTKNNQCVFPV